MGLHLLLFTPYIFTLAAKAQGGVKCPVNWKWVKSIMEPKYTIKKNDLKLQMQKTK